MTQRLNGQDVFNGAIVAKYDHEDYNPLDSGFVRFLRVTGFLSVENRRSQSGGHSDSGYIRDWIVRSLRIKAKAFQLLVPKSLIRSIWREFQLGFETFRGRFKQGIMEACFRFALRISR